MARPRRAIHLVPGLYASVRFAALAPWRPGGSTFLASRGRRNIRQPMYKYLSHHRGQRDRVEVAGVDPESVKAVALSEFGVPDLDLELEIGEAVLHPSGAPLPRRGERRLDERFLPCRKCTIPRTERRLQHPAEEPAFGPFHQQNRAARIARHKGCAAFQGPVPLGAPPRESFGLARRIGATIAGPWAFGTGGAFGRTDERAQIHHRLRKIAGPF